MGYFSFLGDPEGDDLTWIAGLVYWKNGRFPQCLLLTKPVPEASRYPILPSRSLEQANHESLLKIVFQGGSAKLKTHKHKNKTTPFSQITCSYFGMPFTYASCLLCLLSESQEQATILIA